MNNKTRKKITIKDVAELVGVHHSTVSRALNLNKQSKISPQVIKKIKKAADKLGYYPNLMASSLQQNRSFAIGVLIPDLQNSVFPPIIRGIQDTADGINFSVFIANTDDDALKEQVALRSLLSRSIEGVIIATARRNDPVVDACIKLGIPFVLINRNIDHDGVNAVIVDEDFAMQATLNHLFEQKHTRIANIAGPQFSSTGYQRATYFENYMRLQGLESDLIESTQKFSIKEGYNAFKKLYARDKNFTAVVAGTDLIALGCIDAIKELGLSVPEDISVVGNNDIPMVDRMSPALTTISIPKYEMGVQATSILFDIIAGKNKVPMVLKMQPKLIVRDSTTNLHD